MKRCLLFFMVVVILIGCKKKDEKHEVVVSSDHPTTPTLLQGKYDASADHIKEKKSVEKKIKKLDTVINNRIDYLKDWVSNVGEAVDMME
jgi:hypothetical protein